jgi:4-amino-4-deoxy-L-arabinose transferase-like glycosyltransferase
MGQAAVNEAEMSVTATSRPNARKEWLWCVLVALCFTGWGLRTIGPYNIIETDAARHAMNGVFLRDWLASGHFVDVLPYARAYYGHLPALSLPYHPPLFPLIEAFVFAILGVNALTARFAIALCVFGSSVILFRLVMESHRSCALAVFSTVTFLCLPESLWVGADVMLEFPSLLFTLAAIYCLQGGGEEYTMRRALVYAALASAALWTRQQMVFLGAVPVGYFLLMGRWRVFRSAPIWVSSAVIAGSMAALAALSLPFHGAGVNHAIASVAGPREVSTYGGLFIRNVKYYAPRYLDATGAAGAILIVALLVALCMGLFQRKTIALYGSWIASSMLVVLLIRPITTRYLFFTYPALIIVGYAGLIAIAERFTRQRRWAVVLAAGVTVVALVQFPYRTQYLHGPEEAARILAGTGASRILYCGGTDGNFIFNYRALRDDLKTTILTGDKLPPAIFTSSRMEEFAHDYGIQYIVLEKTTDLMEGPWTALFNAPARSMLPERDVRMSSSGRWNGILRIYRFANPSPDPKSEISMRMPMIGGTMEFRLRQ